MARETLQDLIRSCASDVPLSSQVSLRPRLFRGDADQLGRVLNNSFRKLSVIYAFVEAVPEERGLLMSVSIVDMNRDPDGSPVLERYMLDAKESAAVEGLGIDTVPVIELSDLILAKERPLDTSRYAAALLEQLAFVHINRNCIEVLESVRQDGYMVEWAAFRIGYSEGPILQRTGIHLCFYWFGTGGRPHFHLATSEVVEAIQSYTDVHIADRRRLRQISSGPGFDRIDGRVLSKLIDHPIFNYYFAGESPKLFAIPI